MDIHNTFPYSKTTQTHIVLGLLEKSTAPNALNFGYESLATICTFSEGEPSGMARGCAAVTSQTWGQRVFQLYCA